MRQPVLQVCFALTCTIRQHLRRLDYGTEGTFFDLNESPSTPSFRFDTLQIAEFINLIIRCVSIHTLLDFRCTCCGKLARSDRSNGRVLGIPRPKLRTHMAPPGELGHELVPPAPLWS